MRDMELASRRSCEGRGGDEQLRRNRGEIDSNEYDRLPTAFMGDGIHWLSNLDRVLRTLREHAPVALRCFRHPTLQKVCLRARTRDDGRGRAGAEPRPQPGC